MPSGPVSPEKSTNGRIESDLPARAPLALALLAWAAAVSLAAFDGVFARLAAPVDLGLAAFATLFAAATYALDRDVRARVDAAPAVFLGLVALAGDALAVFLALRGMVPMTRGALPLAAFFAAPLGLAANLPALAAPARRFRRAPARSPGARPAAT